MNREESIIVALCRCAMAVSPTDATKHQILRLRRYYETVDGKGEIAKAIKAISSADNEDAYFRVIKSKTTI